MWLSNLQLVGPQVTNTASFLMYLLLGHVVETVVRFNKPLPADHSPTAGSVLTNYYATPGFEAWQQQAITKANVGWILDYSVLTVGNGGSYNQCVQIFNR